MPLRAPLAPLVVTSLFLTAFAAHATPVSDVPDPRPAHAVVDLTHTLTDADVAAIDASARKANGEVMVVVVDSTDGAPSRPYARSYFDRVKIGVGDGRGVLLFVALADHHAEIVLGHRFPKETVVVTDAIMSNVVVAAMKRGDARAALRDGAQSIVTSVLNAPAATAATEDEARVKTPIGLYAIVTFCFGMIAFFVAYIAWKAFGAFRKPQCPKCAKHALRRKRSVTQRATTSMTGLAHETCSCGACGYFDEYDVELPIVVVSHTSSTFTSFDNSSSSFDSSSSSSSSSFDGGSSSSSGSSGSW